MRFWGGTSLWIACPALHDLLKISQRLCDYIDCEIVRSSGESLSCSVFDSDELEKNCLGVSKYVLNASLGHEGFVWNSVFGTEFTFWFGIHPKFCSKTHQFSDNIAQKIEKSVWAKIPAVLYLEIVHLPHIWNGFFLRLMPLKLNTIPFLPMKRSCAWFSTERDNQKALGVDLSIRAILSPCDGSSDLWGVKGSPPSL